MQEPGTVVHTFGSPENINLLWEILVSEQIVNVALMHSVRPSFDALVGEFMAMRPDECDVAWMDREFLRRFVPMVFASANMRLSASPAHTAASGAARVVSSAGDFQVQEDQYDRKDVDGFNNRLAQMEQERGQFYVDRTPPTVDFLEKTDEGAKPNIDVGSVAASRNYDIPGQHPPLPPRVGEGGVFAPPAVGGTTRLSEL
jgi:hypothetical protein